MSRVSSGGKRTKTAFGGIELEVLVEEESAEEALKPLLSNLLQGTRIRVGIRKFQGKPDLLKKLPQRLEGYALSRQRGSDVRVVVLLDQDNDNCAELKLRLDRIARNAGMVPRADAPEGAFQVLNRIAVRELECWYFGDWDAVRKAFPKVPGEVPKKYRQNPDLAAGKASDAFGKVLGTSGVRVASKPQWGKRAGPHLSVSQSRSPSFLTFVRGVKEIVGAP
ncbi:DUF4276 family protein [Streptomyces sp. P38-E01]|uniref:DUF4276 family protein n=1 Tax=Streptomyces tardus TaxID=2780544 RepID=A0A949JES6_9ACTN|nr:DUF4276 family protein [Streptomyces tardus]MBU7597164.1 DUF4276 family protein [Streptomyces tardus]